MTDVSINSQVQSALVRSLETISTKATSLVHHIPDNMPPLRHQQVKVPLDITEGSTAAYRELVDVPQVGYLTKVVLDVTVKPNAAGVIHNYLGHQVLDNVSLKTRNREIETLDGLGMYGQISMLGTQKSLQVARESVLGSGEAGKVGVSVNTGGASSDKRRVRLVLPFSSCDDLSVAYNTLFVEPLQLDLRLRALDISMAVDQVTGASTADRQLSYQDANVTFHYVNYHDLTEQDVRSANFKPNMPAVVFGRDMLRESDASALTVDGTVRVNLRSNKLCYGIAAWIGGNAATRNFPRTRISQIASLRFVGSGQTLYDALAQEACGGDETMYMLSTPSADTQLGFGLYAQDGHLSDRIIANNLRSVSTSASAYRVGHIEFGLSRSGRYNSGTVGLQTLSDPYIEMKHASEGLNGWYFSTLVGNMDVYCYVYYYTLVQIDSGTGAVSRSLDH